MLPLALLAQADASSAARLASDPGWLRLGHYEPDRSSPTGWRSAIHSPEFFLSAEGASDPLAELQATLRGFASDPGENAEDHPRCRFPARLMWLRARLGEALAATPEVSCPRFDGWTRAGTVSSVSVVFATGYLGNPASYYGHTLLKFNYAAGEPHSSLMDVSVNYGAILEGAVDPLSYIVKGVFGGYDGGFSHIYYYFHNHNYGENELRDLWEYRLDLPPEAVALMVAHAWEVLGKRYTYYFFRHNCAYRMAELLEVVDGLHVTPAGPWTMPQAMMQKIAATRFGSKPLVAEVSYHPSRQSRFYEKLTSLAAADVDMLVKLVDESVSLEADAFNGREMASKQALVDALLDYYQFVEERDPNDRRLPGPAYVRALAKRYELPPGRPPLAPRRPAAPDGGRPPGWAQVGWVDDGSAGGALSLRLRPAYYDVLDTGSGHVANAALSMGDVELHVQSGRTVVHRLDIIAIESVNPALSGLPGDRGGAWKLRGGAEQARLGCADCLVARLQGDIGVGRQWLPGLFAAVYVGGAVQGRTASEGVGFARVSATVVVKPSDPLGVRIHHEQRLRLGVAWGDYGMTQIEARRALGGRADLRIRYERDGAELFGIGMGYYW